MLSSLVALKVLPETRQLVKVLAAQRGLEMWELVAVLVEREAGTDLKKS